MHGTGKKLLELMFRPGETVCVSHNKYGFHSLPLESVMADQDITLVPPSPEHKDEVVHTSELIMLALNPIRGQRLDDNCYAFRNFLVELDFGALSQQKAYIDHIGLPWSACVFSGGKSLHYLISLDQDIPTEAIYRDIYQWMLNILTFADQVTKNPSRGIRIPGAYREHDKKQILVGLNGPVKLEELLVWLNRYPSAKPKPVEKRVASGTRDITALKPWVADKLINGLDSRKGRSNQWYSIAYEFALSGFSEDDTIDVLSDYFFPERDFKEREWKGAIKSAFKKVNR